MAEGEEGLKESRIQADFRIDRNDRKFTVRFQPIKSGWWEVTVVEGCHTIHHKRLRIPPNFTNAAKALDEIIIEKKNPRKRKHRFKVVG